MCKALGGDFEKKLSLVELLKRYAEDRNVLAFSKSILILLNHTNHSKLIRDIRTMMPVKHRAKFDEIINEGLSEEVTKNKWNTANQHSRKFILTREQGTFGFILSGSDPVTVESVLVGGNAEVAGLRPGDRLTKLNGLDVSNSSHGHVVKLLQNSGQNVTLEVLPADISINDDDESNWSNEGISSFESSSISDSEYHIGNKNKFINPNWLKNLNPLNKPDNHIEDKKHSFEELVESTLSKKEKNKMKSVLLKFKESDDLENFVTELRNLLNTKAKAALWKPVIHRLNPTQQKQAENIIKGFGDNLEMMNQQTDSGWSSDATFDTMDWNYHINGSIPSELVTNFRTSLQYFLTLRERQQLKKALQLYSNNKNIEVLIEEVSPVLNTPSKRTLWQFILPLLSLRHRQICKRLFHSPDLRQVASPVLNIDELMKSSNKESNLRLQNEYASWQPTRSQTPFEKKSTYYKDLEDSSLIGAPLKKAFSFTEVNRQLNHVVDINPNHLTNYVSNDLSRKAKYPEPDELHSCIDNSSPRFVLVDDINADEPIYMNTYFQKKKKSIKSPFTRWKSQKSLLDSDLFINSWINGTTVDKKSKDYKTEDRFNLHSRNSHRSGRLVESSSQTAFPTLSFQNEMSKKSFVSPATLLLNTENFHLREAGTQVSNQMQGIHLPRPSLYNFSQQSLTRKESLTKLDPPSFLSPVYPSSDNMTSTDYKTVVRVNSDDIFNNSFRDADVRFNRPLVVSTGSYYQNNNNKEIPNAEAVSALGQIYRNTNDDRQSSNKFSVIEDYQKTSDGSLSFLASPNENIKMDKSYNGGPHKEHIYNQILSSNASSAREEHLRYNARRSHRNIIRSRNHSPRGNFDVNSRPSSKNSDGISERVDADNLSIVEESSPRVEMAAAYNGGEMKFKKKVRNISAQPKKSSNANSSGFSSANQSAVNLNGRVGNGKASPHTSDYLDDEAESVLKEFDDVMDAAEPMMPSYIPPPPPGPPPKLDGVNLQKNVSVKRINWEKIDKVDDMTVWSKQIGGADELGEVVKYLELEQQFSTKKSTLSEAFKEKKVESGILGPRKAYNISILLAHLRTPVANVKQALLDMDERILTPDILKQLLNFAPDDKEMELYEDYRGLLADLSEADKFIYQLSRVSDYRTRLQAMLFKSNFDEKVQDVKTRLRNIKKASLELMRSQKLTKILEMMLAMGNYLNKGNDRVGEALGFKISFLSQIEQTKTSDGKANLLHVLAEAVMVHHPDACRLAEDLPTVPDAAKISNAAIVEEMSDLRKVLQQISSKVTELGNQSNKSISTDRFYQTMQNFVLSASEEMQSLYSLQSSANHDFKQVIQYFGGTTKDLTSTEIFTIFAEFLQKFEKAIKFNQTHKRSNSQSGIIVEKLSI